MITESDSPHDARSRLAADPIDVLVVDDVPQNLLAMQGLLARPGLRVLTAESGAAALDLMLEHDVALALLDVQMPDMDGFALAELMRGASRTRGIPIIFLTAGSSDAQRSFRGYEAGAVDFLHKPVEPHVLVSKVAVFVELFDQRRRLRNGMEELERALSLNEKMTAVLAHDLRTPLAALSMGAAILGRTHEPAVVAQTAAHMQSSTRRMERMISQLLDFSRIRAGGLRLDRRSGNLHDLAQAVVHELGQAVPDVRIDIVADGDAKGEFDLDRMMQVISNLVSNAVNHGARDAAIHVHVDGGSPTELVGRVRNRGVIPDEVQSQLFEAFRPSASPNSGLGLGLYIVSAFVGAHGGTVRGWSTADETTFEFRIPRRDFVTGASST